MGQRSRKRGRRAAAPAAAAPARQAPAPQPATRAPSRSEQRAAEIRARLEPLEQGERPGAVTVAAIIAALLGGLNLGLYLAGVKIQGKHPAAGGIILFAGMLLTAAAGMWRVRYWAVLGFQALLAMIVLVFALFLLRASNLLGFVIPVVVIAAAGFLFFKLVRALARIQMPERPTRQ